MSLLNEEVSTKIGGAFTGIWASILAEQLLDDLFLKKYELTKSDTIIFVQQNEWAWYFRIGITCMLFIFIWVLFYYFVPFLIKRLKRLRFSKKPTYSKAEALNFYKTAARLIETGVSCARIYPIDSEEFIAFGFNNIAAGLTLVEKTFSSLEKQKALGGVFRSGEILDDIDIYINPYEYHALLSISQKIIKKIIDANDKNSTLYKDCTQLKDIISKLQTKHP